MTNPPTAQRRATFPVIDAGRLPPRFTTLVGREGDLQAVGLLLDANRLVTLTGAGGTGKTSLAIELARARLMDMPGGVWMVQLETLTDATLVGSTIAATLGLPPSGAESPLDRLSQFLADRPTLLVLDNFEHLLPAAAFVADLLRATRDLRILVTSRAALRLSAEQEYPVPPLAVPAPGETPLETLQRSSVRLYIERARRVRPGYEPTPVDVTAIAEICRRLDGLPLGIELAALRAALLPARAIADRLSERLELPWLATRDVPERQRTLEATIRWSFDLLEAPERRLLARLSVFAGGCDLDAAETVCGPADEIGRDVLDGLSRLAAHGLVEAVPSADTGRFRLLEMVSVFGRRRLSEGDEELEIGRRHAQVYLDLVELAAPNLPGRGQAAWLSRLAVEHDNLRLAVRWAIDHVDVDLALRLGAALWRFWQMRAHLDEGRTTITTILELPGAEAPTTARVRALGAAGSLAWWSTDPEAAQRFYVAELELAETIGDDRGSADAHFNLSFSAGVGNFTTAEHHLRQASRLYVEVGDEKAEARILWAEANIKHFSGHTEEARDQLLQGLQRYQALDDDYYAALTNESLCWTALEFDDGDEAARRVVQALRIWRDLGDIAAATNSLQTAAICLIRAERAVEAATVRAAFESLCQRYSIHPPAPMSELMASHRDPGAIDPAHRRAVAKRAVMTIEDAVDFAIQSIENRPIGGTEVPGDVERSGGAAATPAGVVDEFIREGDVWAITFDGRTTRLRDSKGLGYLARLLAEPGREIAAIDLVAGPSQPVAAAQLASVAELGLRRVGGIPDLLTDDAARTAYRARLIDLQEEIDEAERFGDSERASRHRGEFEFIARELALVTGLGGRPRGAASPAERARQSVTKAIRDSLDRIERNDRALGGHLRLAIRTGAFCVYRPDPRASVMWTTVIGDQVRRE